MAHDKISAGLDKIKEVYIGEAANLSDYLVSGGVDQTSLANYVNKLRTLRAVYEELSKAEGETRQKAGMVP